MQGDSGDQILQVLRSGIQEVELQSTGGIVEHPYAALIYDLCEGQTLRLIEQKCYPPRLCNNSEKLIFECQDKSFGKALGARYLSLLKLRPLYRLPKCAVFSWVGCRNPIELHRDFQSSTPVPGELTDLQGDAFSEQQETAALKILNPKSQDDELMLRVLLDPRPAGICTLYGDLKVLLSNGLMPGFTGQDYANLIGEHARELFAQRGDYMPDDPDGFHQELLRSKTIENGELKSFRSSGIFGTFHGRFEYHILYGTPVRVSFYEGFAAQTGMI